MDVDRRQPHRHFGDWNALEEDIASVFAKAQESFENRKKVSFLRDRPVPPTDDGRKNNLGPDKRRCAAFTLGYQMGSGGF